MTSISRMSSIMNPLGLEQQELFALELGSLASTNINQLAPNFVKIYMTIRYWVRTIMGLIGLGQNELFSLQFQ